MLTDYEIGLLYELYEITLRDTTVVAGGSGQSRLMPDLYSSGSSVRDRLNQAIQKINQTAFEVERVREILKEYAELSLDPSRIDKEGYQLRPENNINNLRKRLYPYTGILFLNSNNQQFRLG